MAHHAAPTTPTAEPNAPQSPTHYSRPSNTFGFRNYVEGQRLTATADTRFSQDLLRTLQSADDHFTVISDQNTKAARTLGTLEIDLKKNTSAVGNLTTRMTAVEASVARLDASVAGLDKEVKVLGRKVVDNHKELKDDIAGKHSAVLCEIVNVRNELKDRIDALEVKVDQLEENHKEVTKRLGKLDYNVAEILSLLKLNAPTDPVPAPAHVTASTSLEFPAHPPIPYIQVSNDVGAELTGTANLLQETAGRLNNIRLRLKRSISNLGRSDSNTS